MSFFERAPAAPPWVSPVFIPTVSLGPYVGRKDRLRLETVQKAVADRWGNGSVYDWNPDGGVYDLYPPPQGRNAEYFPPAPVSAITPLELDDIDLYEEILGAEGARNVFGAEATTPKAPRAPRVPGQPGQAKKVYESVKSVLSPGQRGAVERIERGVTAAVRPPAPKQLPTVVVTTPKKAQEDRTGEYVMAGVGLLAAFGIGYAVGQSRAKADVGGY